MTTSRFRQQHVRAQASHVLLSWGVPSDATKIIADVMVDTDLSAIDSHGISMLPVYEGRVVKGEIDVTAAPAVVQEGDAHALIDARQGLGHPAAVMAARMAADKARASGVAAVAVRGSHHYGACGYYVRSISEQGLLGLTATTTRTVAVVPTGGAEPRLGTNPLAFAAPTSRGFPVAVDVSTATVALNKVKVYQDFGTPLPEGWVLDEHGESVTDPDRAMHYLRERSDGGLTPLGGVPLMSNHKGYGLGLMVQILSATLSGAALAPLQKAGEPDDIGHVFLAVDPVRFRPEGGFLEDMNALVDSMKQTPPSDPEQPVLVPGEPEALARAERSSLGIPLPAALLARLESLCERSGARFVLTEDAAL